MSGPFNASEITGGSYEGVFVADDRNGGSRPVSEHCPKATDQGMEKGEAI